MTIALLREAYFGSPESPSYQPDREDIIAWHTAREGAFERVFFPSAESGTVNQRLEAAATKAAAVNGWVDLEGKTWEATGQGVAGVGFAKVRNGRIDMRAVTTARSIPAAGQSLICGVHVLGGNMFDAGYASTTVTGAIARGDVVVNVASTAGYAAGDVILIHKAIQWGNNATSGHFSEAAMVLRVESATQLRLISGLRQSYAGTAPATTVRKYPAVDLYWRDAEIIGDPSVDLGFGLLAAHTRTNVLDQCRAEGMRWAGLAVMGSFSVLYSKCEAARVDRAGLGYGFLTSSTNFVKLCDSAVHRSRHGIAGGGNFGLGKGLTWDVQVSNFSVDGNTDAAVDMHPGCVNGQLSNIRGSFDPTGNDPIQNLTTSGDAVLWNGVTLAADNCFFRGMRRNGISYQPVTPGDTSIEMSLSADGLNCESTSRIDNTTCGPVVADFSSASSVASCSNISLDRVRSSMQNGISISHQATPCQQVVLSDSAIFARGDTSLRALSGQCLYMFTGTATAKSVRIDNLFADAGLSNLAGRHAVYLQGVAGMTFDDVYVAGLRTQGGNYGYVQAGGAATFAHHVHEVKAGGVANPTGARIGVAPAGGSAATLTVLT